MITEADKIIDRKQLVMAKLDMAALIRGWANTAHEDDLFEIASCVKELKDSREFQRLKAIMEKEHGPIS